MPRRRDPLTGRLVHHPFADPPPDKVSTLSSVGGAPVGSAFVTVGNDATLTNERALAVGTGLSLTDGGANNSITVAISDADLIAIRDLAATAGMLARTGAGAFTARTLTQPAAGLTITNPTGAAGDPTFALADDLAGLEGMSGTGLVARTAANTYAQRTLTAPAAGITITNPAGIAGNPTFALADDLAGLEGMTGTGLVARTASNTYAQRTLTGPAAGITVSNGDGVSGNPTLALANDLSALEGLGSTGIAVRSASDTWVQRSIAVTDSSSIDFTLTNADGVSGNPTITATVIASGVDHGSLGGLTDDDHTQYLLLAGRSGGQTGIGGTGSGDDLTLQSTSHGTKGSLIFDDTQEWWPNVPDISGTGTLTLAQFNATVALAATSGAASLTAITLNPTLTLSQSGFNGVGFSGLTINATVSMGGNAAVGAVAARGTYTNTAAQGLFGAFSLFTADTTLASATASVAPYGPIVLQARPTVSFDGTGTATLAAPSIFGALGATGLAGSIGWFDFTLIRNTSTGTFNASHTTIDHSPRLTESAGTLTVSSLRALHAHAPVLSGSPAITEHVVIDIENILAGGVTTLGCSLRSLGSSVQMRHAGSAIFGSGTSAPTERVHIEGGNLYVAGGSSTGYLDIGEFNTTSDASAPSDNRARVYVRDNGAGKEQLVVRFNTGAVQVLATEP